MIVKAYYKSTAKNATNDMTIHGAMYKETKNWNCKFVNMKK